jgi:hypothetical protein
MMTLKLDADSYEDMRRTLTLAQYALELAVKVDPDNWKEVIRQIAPDEFESASVDDYIQSLVRTTDRLV